MKRNTGLSRWEKWDVCPSCQVPKGYQCIDVRNGSPINLPHKTRTKGLDPDTCCRPHPATWKHVRTFCVVVYGHKGVHRDPNGRTWVDLATRV